LGGVPQCRFSQPMIGRHPLNSKADLPRFGQVTRTPGRG
jgi:hypothetical protein